MTPTDLPLRCACGAVRGTLRGVSPQRGNHLLCYCDDCQSFAHFLGRGGGHTARILDPHGGTEIFQTSPARLALEQGAEHLVCVRLRPNGIFRWYTACCHTPVGNTPPTRQLPLIGLVHTFLAPDTDPAEKVRSLGPIRFRIFARFAKGDRSTLDAHEKYPIVLVARMLRLVAVGRLRGEHRRHPLFTGTGETTATPRVLSEEELEAVETARDEA